MTVVFVTFALLSGLTSLRWSWVAPATSLMLYVFVPFVYVRTLDIPFGVHPGGLVILAAMVAMLALRTREFVLEAISSSAALLIVTLFAVFAVLLTTTQQPANLGLVANTLLVPIVGFGLVRHALRDADTARTLRIVILSLAAVQSGVVLAVAFAGMPQPYDAALRTYGWYSDDYGRAMGTIEHPLQLVVLFTIATPMLLGLRSAVLRLSLGTLFLVATVLTESRSGLLLVIVAFAVVFLRAAPSPWVRMASVLIAVGVVGFIIGSDATETVLAKFSDDGGSANARLLGLDWFSANLPHFLVTGAGAGASFVLKTTAASLENPVAMYSVDFGALPSLLYFAAMIEVLVARPGTERLVDGARLGAALTLVHVMTFSSIANLGPAAPLLWMSLVLAAAPLTMRATAAGGIEPEPRSAAPVNTRASSGRPGTLV